MSIIVATALRPFDHDAREVAGLLAKRMGEKVMLVHVLEPGAPAAHLVRADLEGAAQEISRFGCDVEATVLHGDVLTALTTYARGLSPRLVIIGGAGPDDVGGGERRKARHLIKNLRLPVLCIPHAGPLMQTLMTGSSMRMKTPGRRFSFDACTASDCDVVVLDGRLLDTAPAWHFKADTPPLLFIPTGSKRHGTLERTAGAGATPAAHPR